jgi:hypothetical protein
MKLSIFNNDFVEKRIFSAKKLKILFMRGNSSEFLPSIMQKIADPRVYTWLVA